MIIITGKYGQLGNKLFSYASFIAFSQEHEVLISNPAFAQYARFFEGTASDLFCRYPQPRPDAGANQSLRELVEKGANTAAKLLSKVKGKIGPVEIVSIGWDRTCFLSDQGFLSKAKKQRLIFADGFQFRDPQNLEKHAAVVRNFFMPVIAHRSKISTVMAQIRQQCDVLVGVHIRQGDYKNWCEGVYYYSVDQYTALMEGVEGLFPGQRVGFLVCSNEAEQDQRFARFLVQWGPGHVVEDMYCLAECDFIMGPPSTYAMWASFYGSVPRYEIRDPQINPAQTDFNLF